MYSGVSFHFRFAFAVLVDENDEVLGRGAVQEAKFRCSQSFGWLRKH